MAKTVIALVFTLIVSASMPYPACAAAKSSSKPVPANLGGFSLSATIGGYLFSGSEERDATQSYGLKVGYDKISTSIADSLGIEGSVNYFTTTSKAEAGDTRIYLYRLDAIYPFILGKKWMPFLVVGGGGIVIDTDSHTERSPVFNYGAGLKYFLEDYLAVRADARQLFIIDGSDSRNNFEVGIGVSYYFGKERKQKPVSPPATKQEEKKDAKSGKKTGGSATRSASAIPVLDEFSQSAGGGDGEKKPALQGEIVSVPPSASLVPLFALTPLLALESSARLLFQAEAPTYGVGEKYMVGKESLAKVEAAPAPGEEKTPMQISAPVVAPGETPPSAATIPSPVITGERKPEPASTLPMTEGIAQPLPTRTEEPVPSAAEKTVVRKLAVEFNSDSSYIKPEFHNELVELADIMKSSDRISARIEGHPDPIGDIEHNSMLTEKRAERVRNSLINSGVDPDRISTVVYEPSGPIVDNAATEGNHAILVTLTGEAKTVPAPAAAGEIPAPVKVETVPQKSEPAPAPVEEKKPLQVPAPGVAPAPLAPSTRVETVPSGRAEAMPEPATAEAVAPLKTEPTPIPAGEEKPVQVTAPGVVPAQPARVETAPAPVASEEIPAPTKIDTAPVKAEPAPAPAEEKMPLQVPTPGVAPVPPAIVEAVPAPVVAGEIPAPEKVETAPVKAEATPIPAEEKMPLQGPTPGVALVPPARVEAVPAPVVAGEIPAPAKVETAPVKAEPAPIPAAEEKPLQGTAPAIVPAPLKAEPAPAPDEEKKPVQVTEPGAAPAPPAIVETAPSVRGEAVPAPVVAGEIPAPAKVEAAPAKAEPAPAPVGEEKPVQVTAPGVVPAPLAPPAIVETAPSVRVEAVPAPAAAGGEIPAPAKVETAPLKPEATPIPFEEKKPLQVTAPGVVPAPLAPPARVETVPSDRAEAVPAPVAAEAIPAPASVETAPLKNEAAPIGAGEGKPVLAAPSVATIPSPVTAGERSPEPAPALPVTETQAQPAPAMVEKPARQAVGKKVVRKLAIEFDVDRSYVKPKYYNKLSEIADIMKSSANASARIEGHADSTGRYSYNVKLSKLRAQSVRSSLIKLGVAPDRISTAGYGPSRPIANNATVEGRRRNRRAVTFVTLIIYE